MERRKIIITRATVCDGKSVKPGAEVAASARDARLLVAIGKAKYAPEKAGEAKPEPKGRQRGSNRMVPEEDLHARDDGGNK